MNVGLDRAMDKALPAPPRGAHLVSRCDTQRFTGVLVDNCEHFIFASAAQAIMNKVDAPDMIWIFRP